MANIDKFILEPNNLGNVDERSPETIFELETMTGIVMKPEGERRQILRYLFDVAVAEGRPLSESLVEGYLEQEIIADTEVPASH